jgi:hypothetical protein
VAELELPWHHWVSRGYQQNFASDDKRVAIFNVRAGRVVDASRPIKSNFREPGFTTFLQAGVPNDLLERAIFLRAVSAEVACHPDDARALAQTHSRLDRLPPSILTGR